MPQAAAPARDQFAGRSRGELAAMCVMRGLTVDERDGVRALRRRLRAYQAARKRENVDQFVTQLPRADTDTAARMALIDREVLSHFADDPQPACSRAVARALRRNQQEVLLALQRLGCPRRADGAYVPPPGTDPDPYPGGHHLMTPSPTSPGGEQQPGPDEQLVQRLDALDRANRVRTARAQLKRDLKAGRAQIAPILLEPPECVKTAKVTELLLELPKYGRVRTDRVLAYCRIPATAKIGSLSDQKRADLARSIASHAPRRPATLPVRSR